MKTGEHKEKDKQPTRGGPDDGIYKNREFHRQPNQKNAGGDNNRSSGEKKFSYQKKVRQAVLHFFIGAFFLSAERPTFIQYLSESFIVVNFYNERFSSLLIFTRCFRRTWSRNLKGTGHMFRGYPNQLATM
jgi:hypothetical protein